MPLIATKAQKNHVIFQIESSKQPAWDFGLEKERAVYDGRQKEEQQKQSVARDWFHFPMEEESLPPSLSAPVSTQREAGYLLSDN